MQLDIIVPCYNEQACVKLFFAEVSRVMATMQNCLWRIYFVDDGSRDNTLSEIKALASTFGPERVKYISFARNFGKESAIYAGMQAARGDLLVLMDCDLQDPPALLPQMISDIASGECDCVATRRANRAGEPPVRSFFANAFYRIMNKISEVEMQPSARDYRMMTAQMRDAILSLSEHERFSKGLFAWVGFRTKWYEYENVERAAGDTKWSFFKLLKYAIGGIAAFTTAPLRLASFVGFGTVFIAIVYALYRIFRYGLLLTTDAVLIMLVLFFSGVSISFMGIIGEYVARMYAEVKKRPIYIAKESNLESHSSTDL